MKNKNTIFFVITIVTGEFTMLILQKYGFKVCVISFDLYPTNYIVHIHLPCINTQPQTTAPFNIIHVISNNNSQMPRSFQGSADVCDGDRNYVIIFLLQVFHTINYCKQSLFTIVADLNIFV